MLTQEPRQNGAEIRRVRRERGIKTGELASRIGLAPATLMNLENGHKQTSIEVVHRIARELAIPVADILSDAGRHELERA
jgi:DNA-binding XRE family transcriptional regulator